MAITTNKIFTNSLPEIDRTIILFSNNESLVNLSGVNKHANKTLSNIFFKVRFNAQHPILKDFEFKNLCGYCPDSYWKIICCAFSKGNLHISQSFIIECSPNINKCIQLQKTGFETKHRELCGSFCQDPNSEIDKAWKASEKVVQLNNEFHERMKPLTLECRKLLDQLFENFPEMEQVVIIQTIGIFTLALQNYTDEQILNANNVQLKAIQDDIFNMVREEAPSSVSDKEVSKLVNDTIFTRLPDLTTMLTSNHGSNSQLIRCISKLFIETKLLEEKKGFTDEDLFVFKRKYNDLEAERIKCVNGLQIVEEELTAFGKIILDDIGPSFEIHGELMHKKIFKHWNILMSEFRQAKEGEIASKRLPLLEKCTPLIRELLENPEKTSPDALEKIRQMINSCDIEDIDRIWGTLYWQHANEVHEHQWSEKHFHEFLGSLLEIVGRQVNLYRYQIDNMGTPNSDNSMF